MTKKKLRKSSWQTQKMGIVSFVQALSTLWCINLTYAFTLGRLHTLSKLRTRTSLYASRSLSTVQKRTHECLDYQLIINELASLSKTTLGAQLCKQFHASGVSDANRNYAMVDEISGQLDYLPIRSNLDVWKVVSGIENNTSPPDRSDLVRFSSDMEHIGELHSFFESNAEQFKLFGHLITELALPAAVSETFASSFDHDNNLSIDKYPTIRVLQGGIEALRARITKTIQSLLLLQGMQDKVADSGYVEVDGRYCLMLKNTHKRGVGIVHGSSSTGKTVYVEPHILVEPTNELKNLLSQLREEENRIYLEMCICIAQHLPAIVAAVRAVAEIDVFAAKAKLGRVLNGIIPQVGNEGIIRCTDARHPILFLRAQKELKVSSHSPAVQGHTQRKLFQRLAPEPPNLREMTSLLVHKPTVVGNDFELSATHPALVISGPNAGGKTITLKTAGLFALMVRHGIPIPARPGARVDFFSEVMADIGDMQSVSGDVSTFSGHLLVCRDILSVAHACSQNSRITNDAGADDQLSHKKDADVETVTTAGSSSSSSSSCLVLLDEVGTGTDPAQGAALAQAVLEELVQVGARVMATTHYQRIKELAVNDPRFRIAAMEFVDNIPTYRLRAGSVGESYALEAARRMQLPESVLARADALLDDDTRQLMGLQRRLEEETLLARESQAVYDARADGLRQREATLAAEERRVAEQIQQLRNNVTEQYLEDLRQKEREVENMVFSARELLSRQKLVLETLSKQRRTTQAGNTRVLTAVKPDELSSTAQQPFGDGSSSNSGGSGGGGDGRSLEDLQVQLKNRRVDTETQVIASQTSRQLKATPLAPGQAVEVGTTLVVLEPRNFLKGSKGIVTHRNKGRGKVVLQIAGAEVKMERHLLGLPWGNRLSELQSGTTMRGAVESELSAKERRLLKILEEEIVDPGKMVLKTNKTVGKRIHGAARSAVNTLDLGGVESIQAAIKLVDEYIQKILQDGGAKPVFFAQHGIMCAFKEKLRAWLGKHELVLRHHAAELSEGGDALTIVELRV